MVDADREGSMQAREREGRIFEEGRQEGREKSHSLLPETVWF
jgi:hypothetical protein